jgi:hypothetical protein
METWGTKVARKYRQFVLGIGSFPECTPGETCYFLSIPRYFDEETFMNAVQCILHHTDIDTHVVNRFAPETRLRIRFKNSTVHLEEIGES